MKWWDKLCFEYRKRTFFLRLESNCFRIALKHHGDYVHNGLSVKYYGRTVAVDIRVVWQCELVYHMCDDRVLVYKYSDDWAKEFNSAVWEVNHGQGS